MDRRGNAGRVEKVGAARILADRAFWLGKMLEITVAANVCDDRDFAAENRDFPVGGADKKGRQAVALQHLLDGVEQCLPWNARKIRKSEKTSDFSCPTTIYCAINLRRHQYVVFFTQRRYLK